MVLYPYVLVKIGALVVTLITAKRPKTEGLFPGASIVFWTPNDDKPRPGIILDICEHRRMTEDTLGIMREWTGAYPLLNILAVSPVSEDNENGLTPDKNGEAVFIANIPHVDDVLTQLMNEGKPDTMLSICPRYLLVRKVSAEVDQ